MTSASARAAGSTEIRLFDPDRVAYYEAAGWRAYYDHRWLRLLWLIVSLCQEQFGIPFPVSLVAAYYVARASIAWAPRDHDARVVRRYYAQFYRLAGCHAGLGFDPERIADLELQDNDVHRRLVGNPDKRAFVATLTALHAEIFGLSPDRARESAEWRVEANNVVDLISNGSSIDVEADWVRIEEHLRRCYRALHGELVARAASGG